MHEVLVGQSTTAVGRTNSITGTIAIQGSRIASGRFSVDLTTVRSNKSQLTMHGVTRTVTFTVNALRTANRIDVQGSIPILFSDYKISSPSVGGFVTVDDRGTLEFLLHFTRK